MARSLVHDITLDGEGLILAGDGLNIQRVQANPYAVKSSTGYRSYADLDEWAVFQVDTMHRGIGSELYGDPEEYWYGHSLDTRFKNKVFLGPATGAAVLPIEKTGDVHYAKFGAKLFMSVDKEVYELVDSTWTLRETATATVTSMCEFNGYFYVAQGTTYSILKTATGAASSWSNVGGTPTAHRLYVHGGFLYRSVNQVLYYSADPEGDPPTWSSAIYVGDSQYVIQSMITFQNSLVVFKNDGARKIPGNPGEIDAAYEIGELKWRNSIDSRNGVKCCVWSDGFLYVTWGKAGLLRWTGYTVSPMGLDTLTAGPVIGRIWDLMPTANFLYALVGQTDTQACWLVAWNGSGWHTLLHDGTEARGAYYFDSGTLAEPSTGGEIYLTVYHGTNEYHVTYKVYLPGEIGDPTTGLDSSYQWTQAGALTAYLYTPRFTANLHAAQKEWKEIIIWAENIGTAGAGTQTIRFDYRIDGPDWTQLVSQTIEASTYAQKSYKTEFPVSSFADKTISVSGRTVTLITGSTSDMAVGDWVYFVDVNEYRQVQSIANATHFGIQCNLDGSPASGSTMRPGVPWGRYIQFRISMTSTLTTRTPVLRAWALKYLVNVKDYDMWQATVLIASPRQLRNGYMDKTPISTQLTRLNETRKKGRVPFVDEAGDTHTVKVSNYSIQPVRQKTDERADMPSTKYWARLTLLEV